MQGLERTNGKLWQQKKLVIGDRSTFDPPAPLHTQLERERKEKRIQRKCTGIVPGHSPPAPEDIDKPTFFDEPSQQAGGPFIRSFDLNFSVRKDVS